jgi:hypothetical protein
MAKRHTPVHPRGEVIREREPRNRGRLALLGGAVILATGLVVGSILATSGGESSNTTGTSRGSTPATASPFPQETSSPKSTIPTSPSETTTTTSPTPVDKGYGDRRNAAERYDRCDVAGFTNDGAQKNRIRLNLNLVFENDPTSTQVRSHGENKDLHWDNPIVVAAPLDANGLPTNKNVLTFPAKADQVEGNTSIYMPKDTATDTKYAIGIVTNALTPYGGGEMETTTVTYCNTIVNEGDNHWNKSMDEPAVPLITSVDVYHD